MSVMECVPVCLQSTAGSPLTLATALENQVRLTVDSTHSALCIQTVETFASTLHFDNVFIHLKVFSIKLQKVVVKCVFKYIMFIYIYIYINEGKKR